MHVAIMGVIICFLGLVWMSSESKENCTTSFIPGEKITFIPTGEDVRIKNEWHLGCGYDVYFETREISVREDNLSTKR